MRTKKHKCWNCEHITMRKANGNYICAMQDEEINAEEMHNETNCQDWLLIGTKV